MNNINKIVNLTAEYINQISSDARVTSGLIKFESKNIDIKDSPCHGYICFPNGVHKAFNTHIVDKEKFFNNLKEKIKNNYANSKITYKYTNH